MVVFYHKASFKFFEYKKLDPNPIWKYSVRITKLWLQNTIPVDKTWLEMSFCGNSYWQRVAERALKMHKNDISALILNINILCSQGAQSKANIYSFL